MKGTQGAEVVWSGVGAGLVIAGGVAELTIDGLVSCSALGVVRVS